MISKYITSIEIEISTLSIVRTYLYLQFLKLTERRWLYSLDMPILINKKTCMDKLNTSKRHILLVNCKNTIWSYVFQWGLYYYLRQS